MHFFQELTNPAISVPPAVCPVFPQPFLADREVRAEMTNNNDTVRLQIKKYSGSVLTMFMLLHKSRKSIWPDSYSRIFILVGTAICHSLLIPLLYLSSAFYPRTCRPVRIFGNNPGAPSFLGTFNSAALTQLGYPSWGTIPLFPNLSCRQISHYRMPPSDSILYLQFWRISTLIYVPPLGGWFTSNWTAVP